MPTVFQAIAAVMHDVGAVKKGDRNTQANFNFRGIDAVTNAVYPALVKHGVIVAPKVLSYDYGTVVVGHKRTEMGHARLTTSSLWRPAKRSTQAIKRQRRRTRWRSAPPYSKRCACQPMKPTPTPTPTSVQGSPTPSWRRRRCSRCAPTSAWTPRSRLAVSGLR
jgi:hypothetical protein